MPGCPRSYWLATAVSCSVLLSWQAGIVHGQEFDKMRVVVILPGSLKAYKDKINPHLPFVQTLQTDGDSLSKAELVLGNSLDAVKSKPEAKFIFQILKHTFIPPAIGESTGHNYLSYAFYFRDEPKAKPTLLIQSVLDLKGGHPRTENIWDGFGMEINDAVLDTLATKLVVGKPYPYPPKGFLGLPQRIAFKIKYTRIEDDKFRGSIVFKNPFPIKVRLSRLAYVDDDFVLRKRPSKGALAIDFQKDNMIQPKETKEFSWTNSQPQPNFVRIAIMRLGAP